MCMSKPSVPTPQAPPPPIPQRDVAQQGRQTQVRNASRAGAYEATNTSGPGGLSDPAPVTSPVLGG